MKIRKEIRKMLIVFIILNAELIVSIACCYIASTMGHMDIGMVAFAVAIIIVSIYISKAAKLYVQLKD